MEECPVCFDPFKTPIILACEHKFCYLCIKSTLQFGNYKCPICRADVPQSIVEDAVADINIFEAYENTYVWFYSGRNGGWWSYQSDHNKIIEDYWDKYKTGGPEEFTINICSVDYAIDFINMTQTSTKNFAVRKIKRDVGAIEHKGQAGLRYVDNMTKGDVTYNNYITSDGFNPHYLNSYI
jgi:hypothetical protein